MPTPERPLPVYVQIANHYRNRILNGELHPSDRLPPIAEIAAEWNVAQGTVARAITQLQVEGAIYTSPAGSFVKSDQPISRTPSDRVKAGRRIRINGDSVTVTETGIVAAPDYVASLIGIEPGTQVIRREEITWRDRHPRLFSVDWIPATDRDEAADLLNPEPIPGGALTVITAATGRTVTHWRDHMRARASDAREATALRLPVGSPILAGAHLWSDDEGVLLYGEWVMPPDQVISYEGTVEPGDAE